MKAEHSNMRGKSPTLRQKIPTKGEKFPTYKRNRVSIVEEFLIFSFTSFFREECILGDSALLKRIDDTQYSGRKEWFNKRSIAGW